MVRESVPEGYKEIEVGVIPEDWEVKRLGEILDNARLGGNYPNSELETKHPLIKMGNIDRGSIDTSKVEYVAEGYIPADKDKLHYGDVLFNTRNTLELVGKVAIWRNELPCAYYNSNLLRLGFKPCYVGSNFFINYVFNTKNLLSQLKGFATGTTSVAAIYSRDLYEVKIPLPPLPEQKAIAAVLSDVDELIASMEKLIDKKEKIKQGTMQLLLTGKKRLPGFTGDGICMVKESVPEGYKQTEVGVILEDWEKVKIKDVAPLQRGFDLPNKNLVEGKYPVVYSNGINNYHNEFKIKPPGVVTGRSGTIGKVTFLRDNFWPHNTSLWVTDFKNNEPEFIYYLYTYLKLERFGTGSGVPTLNRNDVHSFIVSIPPLPEQQAIAQILSDMDSEIESLQKKRDKYKLIKEGMMDKLLTGKVRLI